MRVALLGDSITQGLGSKRINFTDELSLLLPENSTVFNLAESGTVIDYVKDLFPLLIKEKIDVAVILYGNVDAMVRPSRTGKVFKQLPKRFRNLNGAMIMPRPFYSHKWYKRFFQYLENYLRTVFRKLVLIIDGTEQWMPFERYVSEYAYVCAGLREMGITPVICSTVFIDDDLFNGSDSEYRRYNKWMKDYAEKNNIPFVDLYNVLKKHVDLEGWQKYYNHDHFHPNGTGYLVMAESIAKSINNEVTCSG